MLTLECVDGKWFLFDGNSSIIRYECNGTDFIKKNKIVSVNETWPVWGNSGYAFWLDKYVSVDACEGYIYYNDKSHVYRYNPSTKTKETYYTLSKNLAKKGYIYGLNIDSGKNLYVCISTSPNERGTVHKVAEINDVTYSIDYELNGGTNHASNPSRISSHIKEVTLLAPRKVGYQFEGWYLDSELTQRITTISGDIGQDVMLYAKWVPYNYKILYKDGKKVVNEQQMTYGQDLELWTREKTGYTLSYWTTPDGKKYTSAEEVLALVKKNNATITLTEKWTPITYSVSFEPNVPVGTKAVLSGSMDTQTGFKYGTAKTLKSLGYKLSGYTFDSWNTAPDGSGTKYKNKASAKNLTFEESNVTLYAQWKQNTYKITYANAEFGKSGVTDNPNIKSYSVESESIYELSEPTRIGYIFNGWYSDSKYKKPITELDLSGLKSITVYAKWIPIAYSVNYDSNVPADTKAVLSGFMDTQSGFKYGTAKTLKSLGYKLSGYTFDSWNTAQDGSGTKYKNKASAKNITSEEDTVTLYAQWKLNSYAINYPNAVVGKSGVTENPNIKSYSIESESTYVLNEPTRTGYIFEGWYSDSKYKKPITELDLSGTKNLTVYAKWTPIAYSVEYDPNLPADTKAVLSGSMDTQTGFKYGTAKTLKSLGYKLSGYTFDSWNTAPDGSGTKYKNKSSVKNLTSEEGTVTLYAQWKLITYKITYANAVVGKSGVTANSNIKSYSVETGSTYTLSSPTRTGYVFEGWYTDSKYKRPISVLDLSAKKNITVYAKWAKGTVASKGVTWRVVDDTLYIEGNAEGWSVPRNANGTPTPEWKEAKVTSVVVDLQGKPVDVSYMFSEMSNVQTITFSNFDTSNVENMRMMFYGCESLTSVDVSGFDTGNVCSMSFMFYGCKNLNFIDVSNFNTNNVISIGSMFGWCESLTSVDVSNLDTSNVTSLGSMFYNCESLSSIDVSGFDTRKVSDMSLMFGHCSSLTSVDVSSFDTRNVKNMYQMFHSCNSLRSVDVSKFDTRNVTNMSSMFCGCESLESLDVSKFDTSNVTNMYALFSGCSSLTSIDVSRFDTRNVLEMGYMFSNCDSLTNVDLSSFTFGYGYGTNFRALGLSEEQLKSYEITYVDAVVGENGVVANNNKKTYTIIDENSYKLSAPERSGYQFVGWYLDAEYSTPINTLDLTQKKPITVYAKWEKEDVAEESVTWRVVDNTLYIEGKAEGWSVPKNADGVPSPEWGKENTVTSIVVDLQGKPVNLSSVFRGMSNAQTITFVNLDTSNVTDMSRMFDGCSALTSVDVSGFDTRNVTMIEYMFSGCSSLTNVDLSNFTFPAETNYRTLGLYADQLKSYEITYVDAVVGENGVIANNNKTTYTIIDESSYTLSAPERSGYQFAGWYLDAEYNTPIDALDLTQKKPITVYAKWEKEDVAEEGVTWRVVDNTLYIEGKAEGWSVPKNADGVPSPEWVKENTVTSIVVDLQGKPVNLSSMFRGMSNTQTITFVNFDTGNVTDMSRMFDGCSALTSVNVGGFDTGNVTNMHNMFTFCAALESLDVSGFNTCNVADMRNMFYDCESLTSIDVSGFDTSKATDMGYMFCRCSSLESVDVSSFDTSNVTYMGYMFHWCSSLESVDVSGFDTSNVTDMSYMFSHCTALTNVDLSNFTFPDGTDYTNLGLSAEQLKGTEKPVPYSITYVDAVVGENGVTINNNKMTYSIEDGNNYTLSAPERSGYQFIGWYSDAEYSSPINTLDLTQKKPIKVYAKWEKEAVAEEGVTWRVVDSTLYIEGKAEGWSVPKNADGVPSPEWGKENTVTSIVVDLQGKPVNLSSMFRGMSNAQTITFVNFDTGNVTDMSRMFDGCSALTSLDVSGFDTSNVTDMSEMFGWCDELKSVDVSGFDTSNVTNMLGMFCGCNALKSLDVSGFDTSKVINMEEMFSGCSELTSVDVSGFDTSNVTNMLGMFCGCNALTSLDVSGFDTSNVTNMEEMFYGCSELKSVNLSGFDTSNVTNMLGMFCVCSALVNVDVSGFNTSKVTDIGWMFFNCSLLESVDVSGFDTSNVTNMSYMFYQCSELSGVDVSNFDTSKVTDMSRMFANCSLLKNVDLSNFTFPEGTDYTNLGLSAEQLKTL